MNIWRQLKFDCGYKRRRKHFPLSEIAIRQNVFDNELRCARLYETTMSQNHPGEWNIRICVRVCVCACDFLVAECNLLGSSSSIQCDRIEKDWNDKIMDISHRKRNPGLKCKIQPHSTWKIFPHISQWKTKWNLHRTWSTTWLCTGGPTPLFAVQI